MPTSWTTAAKPRNAPTASAYDAILMDMQMPVMDGLHATALIRRDPAHAHTPILAMTASAYDDDRQACLDAGMNDHIAKPVEPKELYAKLAQWALGGADGPRRGTPSSDLVPAARSDAAPPTARAPSTDELDAFERLLASGDFTSGARYRELESQLLARFDADARPIGRHLRRHDYAGALQVLRRLRARATA